MNVKYLGCYDNSIDQFFIEGTAPNGQRVCATLHMRRVARGHDEPITRRYWWNQSKTCLTANLVISDCDSRWSKIKRMCEYARYRTGK